MYKLINTITTIMFIVLLLVIKYCLALKINDNDCQMTKGKCNCGCNYQVKHFTITFYYNKKD